jgi:hypothetical protein
MVELARQRAPDARFARSSLLDAELPACVAVTAIGKCLNYTAHPRATHERLGGLFARIQGGARQAGLRGLPLADAGRLRPCRAVPPRPRRHVGREARRLHPDG